MKDKGCLTETFLCIRLVLSARVLLLLIPTTICRDIPTRTEYEVKAVVTDPILLALVKSMEVKVNIMEEEQRAKATYERGVKAMQEAYGKEMM